MTEVLGAEQSRAPIIEFQDDQQPPLSWQSQAREERNPRERPERREEKGERREERRERERRRGEGETPRDERPQARGRQRFLF